MAMSRALRDVLRKENGMVPKKNSQDRQAHACGDQVTAVKKPPVTSGSTPAFMNMKSK